tara:strand:+ start:89 stop:271 length:183 start_codon:yes stop_codon:yes gene_type:complete
MSKKEYTNEQFYEITEDAFVNIKKACMRLQERTRCGHEVVIKMFKDVAQFYILQDNNKNI